MGDDDYQWRQVKDRHGRYVHRSETHTYPGPGDWNQALCAVGNHDNCRSVDGLEFARREAEAASDTVLVDTGTYFVRVPKKQEGS